MRQNFKTGNKKKNAEKKQNFGTSFPISLDFSKCFER